MEQQTGSTLGKEYLNCTPVYYHPAYLTEYVMQNAELNEVQAGIKFAVRNISNLRYADDIWHLHPYGRKRRTKEPLDESEKGEWKICLKTQHSEN